MMGRFIVRHMEVTVLEAGVCVCVCISHLKKTNLTHAQRSGVLSCKAETVVFSCQFSHRKIAALHIIRKMNILFCHLIFVIAGKLNDLS